MKQCVHSNTWTDFSDAKPITALLNLYFLSFFISLFNNGCLKLCFSRQCLNLRINLSIVSASMCTNALVCFQVLHYLYIKWWYWKNLRTPSYTANIAVDEMNFPCWWCTWRVYCLYTFGCYTYLGWCRLHCNEMIPYCLGSI